LKSYTFSPLLQVVSLSASIKLFDIFIQEIQKKNFTTNYLDAWNKMESKETVIQVRNKIILQLEGKNMRLRLPGRLLKEEESLSSNRRQVNSVEGQRHHLLVLHSQSLSPSSSAGGVLHSSTLAGK
jgi:hypothetical protein